jgi:hypothetical protein
MLDPALKGIDCHNSRFRRFAEIFEQPTGRATFEDADFQNPKVRRFLGHSGKDELPARNAAAEPVLREMGFGFGHKTD